MRSLNASSKSVSILSSRLGVSLNVISSLRGDQSRTIHCLVSFFEGCANVEAYHQPFRVHLRHSPGRQTGLAISSLSF